MRSGVFAAGAALLVCAATIAVAGCGEQKGPVATVHVGLPLSGKSAARARDMQRAVELAFEQSGDAAGGRRLELRTVNTGSADDATKAALMAVRDERSLALIAGASYASSFQADATTRQPGLLQVAPAGGVGLDPARYGELLPTAVLPRRAARAWLKLPRNLIFVAPSDFATGQAVVQHAAAQGAKRIEWDAANLQKSVLEGMRIAAERAGVELNETTGGTCPDENAALVRGVEPLGEEPIFPFIACPSEVLVVDSSGGAVDPQYGYGRRMITPALAYDDLPLGGKRFIDEFEERYGHPPDRWAIFAYEAAGLTLEAIDKAEEDAGKVTRETVHKAAFAIRNRFGPAGHYDVLPTGDTTLFTLAARKLALGKPGDERTAADDTVVEVVR